MTVPLLITKLDIPHTRPNHIQRPRLFARLDEGWKRPLTLVSAPAGYGKTSALSAWIAESERSAAWLALDEGDNEPTRFWMYVIAALQRLKPKLGENAKVLLRGQEPERHRLESFLTVLLNEIAESPDDFALVLDDYQVIDTASLHDGIAFLVDHLPAPMHLIVAGRADPPLPLARWRGRGQLGEIRADDLRFNREETSAFLNQRMGLNLSASDIAALEGRTEGWIAGLQLAALSLQGRADAAAFIAAFTGSHHYIIDYLTEEVLQRQREEIQSFLLHTCILDRLCGPLCDAVTGEVNGQAMLEHLDLNNLFTVRLDDERHWYRYHQLFAEVLRLRLQRTKADQVVGLHRRAAAWYEEHQFIDDALRHALAADDAEWAARMVEQHADEVLRRGEGVTFRRWLSAIPQQVVRARPRLALALALAEFNVGHLDAVEPLLEDAERAGAAAPVDRDKPYVIEETSALSNVPAAIALLRATLAGYRGDAERMRALAQSALSYLSEEERGPAYSVRWNLALADWMRGDMAEAERAFAEIAAEGQAAGQLHLALSAGSFLARVQRARGRLSAADRTCRQGLELAAHSGLERAASAGTAHLGLADVLYERNQLEQALHHAAEGITLARQLTSTQPLASGLATMAWIRQALGDPMGARAAMDEAFQVMPSLDVVALQNPVPAERARLLLAQGEEREVARWMESRGVRVEDEPAYPREREYLLLARVLLANKAPDRALGLLERLAARAQAEGRNESVVEARLLQALAFHATGDPVRAVRALESALGLAEPGAYIRLFVDEGEPMRALLSNISGEHRRYAEKLLAAFVSEPKTEGPTSSHVRGSLIEPLSERELEILSLLAGGLTNREIAERLVLSVGTVKVHLKHIYGKLDAHSRTQAIVRARGLNLL